ncbi:MAG: hypothetical protein WC812_02190 [Candidatus Pacearchaeota archaeon]|jgi:hypothetical protein
MELEDKSQFEHNFLGFDINELSQDFIQIYINNCPYFQFIRRESMGSAKHSEALEKILEKFKVNYNKIRIHGKMVPEKNKDGEYQLVGAGKCFKMVDYFEFIGNSSVYNCEPNKKHFDETKKPEGIKFICPKG